MSVRIHTYCNTQRERMSEFRCGYFILHFYYNKGHLRDSNYIRNLFYAVHGYKTKTRISW